MIAKQNHKKKKSILFYTPHVAIWAHTVPEMYLAKGLNYIGHNVQILTCGAAMNYCSAMTARRVNPNSDLKQYKNICQDCIDGSKAIQNYLGIHVNRLSQFGEQKIYNDAHKLCEQAILEKNQNLKLFNINIGKISLYEFILIYKKKSLIFSNDDWNNYFCFLYNTYISLFLFKTFLASQNHPDAIFAFSPQYSNIHACVEYAKTINIPTYFCESGNNLSHRLGTMRVWNWNLHKLVNPGLGYWKGTNNHKLTKRKIYLVKNHLQILLKANHFTVFSTSEGSTNKNKVFDIKNATQNKKVFLMTMSSADEAYAAYVTGCFPYHKVFSNVFTSQLEWIESTISFFDKKNEFVLIIRVHPRDFPNKRDNVQSEQANELLNILNKKRSKNIIINWPNENISLYDLLKITDVMITAWSATAIEAMVYGIPVVTYDKYLPSFPADIHWTGTTKDEYFSNLQKASQANNCVQNKINAFRWLGFNFTECIVEVCKSFGDFEIKPRYEIKIINKLIRQLSKLLPHYEFVKDLIFWRQGIAAAKIVSRLLDQKASCLPELNYPNKTLPKLKEQKLVESVCKKLITNS